MNELINSIDILNELDDMYDPEYQNNLFIVDRALEQAKGFPASDYISQPESELLDAKLLELIDSVAMG